MDTIATEESNRRRSGGDGCVTDDGTGEGARGTECSEWELPSSGFEAHLARAGGEGHLGGGCERSTTRVRVHR